MRMPDIQFNGKREKQIIEFKGLNYSGDRAEGEFIFAENLSSDSSPNITQRAGRKTFREWERPSAVYSRGKIITIDNGTLYYGDTPIGPVTEGEKQFAAVNTKVVIFPDKMCYDTETGLFSSLEALINTYAGGMCTFSPSALTLPQTVYTADRTGVGSFVETTTGSTYIYPSVSINNASGSLTFGDHTAGSYGDVKEGDILKYDTASDEYLLVIGVMVDSEALTNTIYYEKYRSTEHHVTLPELCFKEGDGIEIEGCVSYPGYNGVHIIRSISGYTITFDENIFSDDGFSSGTRTEKGTVSLARKLPDLTIICESGNRLWGAAGQTIYASALGDPTNFFIYDGVDTDSYAVAVGTDGEFTGCMGYGSNVLFWKENCLHKVMGSFPSEYAVYSYIVPGLKKGSEKSMAIANEILYYHSKDGIYAYTGSTPVMISAKFGTKRYENAVGGTDGRKYFVSMEEKETGEWGLFVYDPQKGIWQREDSTKAIDFTLFDGKLYCLSGKKVLSFGEDDSEEGMIPWQCEFSEFTEKLLDRKIYSRLSLRADLEAESYIKVEMSVDHGPYRQIYIGHDEEKKTVSIPICPGKCDRFSVRLSGEGRCNVKSLVRDYTIGGIY